MGNFQDGMWNRNAMSPFDFAIQGFQQQPWNADNIMQALPEGGVPFGNVIPFGYGPERETSAEDIANMYRQAVGATGVDIPIPNPAGTDITTDEFNAFMDTIQNFYERGQVNQRADAALGFINDARGEASANPNLARASAMGMQNTPMDLDIYEAMRQSAENIYNPRAQAQNVAARGTRGSSGSELAALQNRSQHSANMAGIYPQALNASQQVQANQQQMALAPYQALQAAQVPREQAYMEAVGRLFGSPNFLLS